MQKLLIVLAIQFCLPWAALLLECCIPFVLWRHLDDKCVEIQLACVGCIVGLLRPQWPLMLLGVGAICCYCFVWNLVHAHRHPFSSFNDSNYLEYQLHIALLAFVMSSILSTVLEIDAAKQECTVRKMFWQYDIRHLLYLASVSALLAASFASRPVFLKHGLNAYLISFLPVFCTTAIFYSILWYSWRWWRLLFVLLICGIVLGIFRETHHKKFIEIVVAHVVFVFLAIVTSVLYRSAGLRIDLRQRNQVVDTI